MIGDIFLLFIIPAMTYVIVIFVDVCMMGKVAKTKDHLAHIITCNFTKTTVDSRIMVPIEGDVMLVKHAMSSGIIAWDIIYFKRNPTERYTVFRWSHLHKYLTKLEKGVAVKPEE